MAEKTHRYNLNIPISLWEKIKQIAQKNRRHTSQEILRAIENHWEGHWQSFRAEAFDRHCAELHDTDFEVCPNPQCRAVVVEEVRRGLTSAEDVYPPIEERKHD